MTACFFFPFPFFFYLVACVEAQERILPALIYLRRIKFLVLKVDPSRPDCGILSVIQGLTSIGHERNATAYVGALPSFRRIYSHIGRLRSEFRLWYHLK